MFHKKCTIQKKLVPNVKKRERERNIFENKTGKEGGKDRLNFYEMTFMLCTINHIDRAKSEFFLTLEFILKMITG